MKAADLGLSARDVARIKAQAERTTGNAIEAALDDLDAPWRVLAIPPGFDPSRFSGQPFGSWKGRALIAWPREPGKRPRRP